MFLFEIGLSRLISKPPLISRTNVLYTNPDTKSKGKQSLKQKTFESFL